MKKVSVLIPAYNCSRYIDKAVSSILNQTYSNLEVLIIDDCSSDNTLTKLKAITDRRVKIYINKINLGYLQSCNLLFEKANGDYITFQDADDYSAPNRIETLVGEFDRDELLSCLGSNMIRVDKNGAEVERSKFKLNGNDIKKYFLAEHNFVGAGLMIKKEVYEEIGGYNLLFDRIGSEDVYWFYLICEKFKVRNLSDYLYYYRHNPNSISGKLVRFENMISGKIVSKLIQQRIQYGSDDLEKPEKSNMNLWIYELKKPYLLNPSKFELDKAKFYFYSGFENRVLACVYRAIITEPTKIYNYRTFFYYSRLLLKRYLFRF